MQFGGGGGSKLPAEIEALLEPSVDRKATVPMWKAFRKGDGGDAAAIASRVQCGAHEPDCRRDVLQQLPLCVSNAMHFGDRLPPLLWQLIIRASGGSHAV